MPNRQETEEQLVQRAQQAVSHCNWEIGECAAAWTQRYARGRTDADFGALIGLSGDQVYQRRRVWETFSDVSPRYERLKWSHFYAALNWDDAAECLQWADDMQATVAEMKAWRRAQHGEDLSAPADDSDDAGALAGVDLLPVESGFVREPGYPDRTSTGESRRREGPGRESEVAVLSGAARESTGDDYAPFGAGARGAAPVQRGDRPDPSAETVLRRVVAALERCDASLTPDALESLSSLPVELQRRLFKSLDGLNSKLAGYRV
jgi:hypothetical protein